jgi:hypothetical protein
MTHPATERPAPATIAVMILGKRICQITSVLCSLPKPKNVLITSHGLIYEDPALMDITAMTKTASTRKNKISHFLLIYWV